MFFFHGEWKTSRDKGREIYRDNPERKPFFRILRISGRDQGFLSMRQQPEAHCQENTGVALKSRERPEEAHPDSGPECNGVFLVRSENGSA